VEASRHKGDPGVKSVDVGLDPGFIRAGSLGDQPRT
jgi:hypothetical protein